MDAKQKAKELVDKFDKCKVCAIICIEEVIEEANLWHYTNSYEESTDFEDSEERIKYLNQVKEEINKL